MSAEQEQFDSKDIYLMEPKTGEIIGLHAIGVDNSEWDRVELDGTVTKEKGFQAIEKWGNPYGRFLMFQGNSFRVHDDINRVMMEFINDGWVDLDTEKVKKFNELTVELLMHKYLYYEKNMPRITDYEYDMKERDWQKLGTEIGLPMEEYPHWVDFDRNHKEAYRAIKLAEERYGIK
jgi:hypothetical protein